ncbi:MAG: hypothetical protein QOJ68_2015 [Blastococcus sp.]|jgi:hypothetical protein|nr:hypothetical protein [Blastococcus sp.]
MRRRALKGATVLLAAGALISLGMSPASANDGHRHREIQQTVHVTGNGSSVHLDHATVWSGSIRFAVSTTNKSSPDGGGSAVTLFRIKPGKSTADLMKGFNDEFSPKNAALGTRELTAAATFRGLADVVVHSPEVVTEYLSPGTYYLLDLGNTPKGPPHVTTLTVKQAKPRMNIEQDSDLASQTTIRATSADRFVAPRNWPHKGTYTFRNTSDTLHFMELQPVKKNTTDKQIQKYFDSHVQTPPPFLKMGPSGGNDVVSPGKSLQVTYNLPRGTYVLLCFVSDDKTGMPHAVMGMHKVVVLR